MHQPAPLKLLPLLAAALACGLAGAAIAFVPHVAARINHGSWEFYHDQDELLYRLVAKPALEGSLAMRDVFVQANRPVPTTYSWFQFVPTSHLARLMGYNAINLGQYWRLAGGFIMGIALFSVFCMVPLTINKRLLFAILCTVLALSDAGFVSGRILIDQFRIFFLMLQGRTAKPEATAFLAYRIITPLWNLPYALIAAACLGLGWSNRSKTAFLFGALFTALTIWLYFFQWTALIAGSGLILALFLAVQLVRKNPEYKTTSITLMALSLGFLGGLPQIVSNAVTFSSAEMKPILDRVGRGQKIPADEPILTINIVNRWGLLKIAVAFAIAYKLKSRYLALFSSIGLAAYALSNSALITKLEFENWHWLYVLSPFTAVVIYFGLMAALWKYHREKWAVAIVACYFISSLGLRWFEAEHAPEAVKVRTWFEAVRPLRNAIATAPDDGQACLAGPFQAHMLALSLPGGRLLFHDPHSSQTSLMPLDEVIERYTLNQWLQGATRESVATRPPEKVFKLQIGPRTRPEWAPEVTRTAQLDVFDHLEATAGKEAIAKYQPNWLLLEKSSLTTQPQRGGPWTKAAESDSMVLYRRDGGR